ncbi:glycosyltransferase family 4 protein [bacterium]|nr:glycosyltransferase family 4 protein [bacterium]
MKIVSITTAFPRSDSDVLIPWIIRLITLLKEKGVETDVFTSSYCGRKSEISRNINVFRFRYFFRKWEKLSHDMSVPEKLKGNKLYFLVLPFFMIFGMISACFYAKKNDFDIIHVHFPFPLALFGMVMKSVSKKPLVMTCHGSEVNMAKKNPVFRKIFNFMLKYADFITVNSTFMKNEVEKIIRNKNVGIIPMGAGIGEIAAKETVKKEQKTKTKILFVGRLIEVKGVKYLIDAVKLLDPEKFELHIAGDGPEREKLEKTAPENVIFHGYQTGKNLEELYRNADVFVLPSIVDNAGYTEGLGTVLLEAANFSIPLIGTDVGGIPDIIIDGKTGLLVPQKDPDALCRAIKTLAENRALCGKLTENAHKHVKDNFSWEVITEKFFEIYSKF